MLNIAVIKEKLTVEFEELKAIYMKAYKKAKEIANNDTSLKLQVDLHNNHSTKFSFTKYSWGQTFIMKLKALNLLKETQISYMIEDLETQKIINSLNEIKKIRSEGSIEDDDEASKSDRESEQQEMGKKFLPIKNLIIILTKNNNKFFKFSLKTCFF